MTKKSIDYQKEQYRGTLKQIMKVRGLRAISLTNYNKWVNMFPFETSTVHSLKIDIQDGYINLFTHQNEKIDDAPVQLYHDVYERVNEILQNEKNIPYKIKRNILVKVGR